MDLLPGVRESYGTVLEFLAYDLYLLVVLLAVLPVLLVVHAVATCALLFLHSRAIDCVLERDGEVAWVVGSEHPLQQLTVAVVYGN